MQSLQMYFGEGQWVGIYAAWCLLLLPHRLHCHTSAIIVLSVCELCIFKSVWPGGMLGATKLLNSDQLALCLICFNLWGRENHRWQLGRLWMCYGAAHGRRRCSSTLAYRAR